MAATAEQMKILRDLQYRISVSDPNDPERKNVERLLARLLAKYGVSSDELAPKTADRTFGCYTPSEAQMVFQYMYVKMGVREDGPYNFRAYTKRGVKRNKFFVIALTDDDFNRHAPIIDGLLSLYREQEKKLKAQLKRERRSRVSAWKYVFYKAGNMLNQPGPDDKPKAPDWGLSDALAAARSLDGIVFPENYLYNERKALEASSK